MRSKIMKILLLSFIFVMGASAMAQDSVNFDIGTIPQGKQVVLTYDVVVGNLPAGTIYISNQGTVSGSNFDSVLSNDPQTDTESDPTLTQVGFNLQISQLPLTGETPWFNIFTLSLIVAVIGTGISLMLMRHKTNMNS